MVLNIAHRGLSGLYPENTLLAFQKALELGVDAIELDVQLSKDGQVMVFHDEELARTTGQPGLLMERTCAELQSLDASGRFGSRYGQNRIPTLAEYLEFTQHTGIVTFLELKNSMIPYPGLEQKTADVLAGFNRTGSIVMFSANHPSVKLFGRLAPQARLLFPLDNWIYNYGAYCRAHQISMCMPYFRALNAGVVAEIKVHQVELIPWTVDDPADMRAMIELGVDGLLTNRPDLLKDLLAGNIQPGIGSQLSKDTP